MFSSNAVLLQHYRLWLIATSRNLMSKLISIASCQDWQQVLGLNIQVGVGLPSQVGFKYIYGALVQVRAWYMSSPSLPLSRPASSTLNI